MTVVPRRWFRLITAKMFCSNLSSYYRCSISRACILTTQNTTTAAVAVGRHRVTRPHRHRMTHPGTPRLPLSFCSSSIIRSDSEPSILLGTSKSKVRKIPESKPFRDFFCLFGRFGGRFFGDGSRPAGGVMDRNKHFHPFAR